MIDGMGGMPNAAARMALAARFGLPYADDMQDWEWEVADRTRFGEFLETYGEASLPDVQLATLMEVLLQCVEEMEDRNEFLASWSRLEPCLVARADLHLPSIVYWAMADELDPTATFRLTQEMRGVLRGLSRST